MLRWIHLAILITAASRKSESPRHKLAQSTTKNATRLALRVPSAVSPTANGARRRRLSRTPSKSLTQGFPPADPIDRCRADLGRRRRSGRGAGRRRASATGRGSRSCDGWDFGSEGIARGGDRFSTGRPIMERCFPWVRWDGHRPVSVSGAPRFSRNRCRRPWPAGNDRPTSSPG